MATKMTSILRSNQVGLSTCLSNLEHIMGDKVRATKPDTITEPASANANSVNKRPVRPGVNAKGAYTAASVMVMATTAKPISLAPRMDASKGDMPSSMWR